MTINILILEVLNSDKKKKLKKLAIAGGLAALGGAGIQHLRNKLTQHEQKSELHRIAPRAIKNTVISHAIGHSVRAAFGEKPQLSHAAEFGKDVITDAGKSYIFHGIGHAVSNLRHGKNTFFNQQKKHNTQRLVTGALNLGDFVHDAHKLYKDYKSYKDAKNQSTSQSNIK